MRTLDKFTFNMTGSQFGVIVEMHSADGRWLKSKVFSNYEDARAWVNNAKFDIVARTVQLKFRKGGRHVSNKDVETIKKTA